MKRVGFDWIGRGSCRHPQMMTIKGGSLRNATFPAMVGVIRHPDAGVLLFDTGYDDAFMSATQRFPERLYRWATPYEVSGEWRAWLVANDVVPDSVTGLILSHFHGDHVAGLPHCGGLPIYCSAAGLAGVRRGNRLTRTAKGLLADLVPDDVEQRAHYFERASAVPLPSAFAPFTEGRDVLGDGSLLAVELPGHCAGHWGLALRTVSDRFVLLAADAAWSGAAITRCVPPPRVTTALLGETAAYRMTLAQLHRASVANPSLTILPSHCAESAAAFRKSDAT